jgi:glycosyltransferase involved in cell wall biosynthesis
VSGVTRVSIVTPFLNPGRFFEEAIESALAQTFADWELLLVDDGSADGSTETAQRYARKHPTKIRYLSHPARGNRGASASRNLGIRHAAGEYLAFLDADDVYLTRKLEEQVPILDAVREAQVLYAATEYWYGWTGEDADIERDAIWQPSDVEIDKVIEPPQLLTAFLRDGGNVPCMGSMLVRRDAAIAVGGFEDSFTRICTDQVFHAKLTLRFRVLFSDVCWDRYRQHPDSSCRTIAAEGKTAAAFETYLRWLERYLVAQQVSDPEVWSALKTALRPYGYPLLRAVGRRARRHGRQVTEFLSRAGLKSPRSIRR